MIDANAPKSLPSQKKKFSNDFKAAKEVFEFYARNRRAASEVSRIRENFDLHVGRWTNLERFEGNGYTMQMDDELVEVGKLEILHYPIVNRVTSSMLSDLIKMGLSYNIKDNSAQANNLRKEKRLQIVNAALTEKYIKPLQEEISAQVMQESGADTTQPMDSQTMQQIQELISKRMQEQTPKSIQEAIKSVRTPDEKLANALLAAAIKENSVKEKFVDGGTYAICAGEEYYRISLIDNYIHFEDLNPENLVWGGSQNVEDCQDGQYAVYRQNLTAEDCIQRYGTLLSVKQVKDMYDLFSPMANGDTSEDRKKFLSFSANDLLPMYKANPEIGNIDYRTKEGQQQMWALRAAIQYGYNNGGCIVETYVTWRWTRKMKMVERLLPDGKKERLFFDEHYEEQPDDISVIEIYNEEVWEGAALGEGENREFVYLKPVEFQYTDLKNPRKPKLTIYGGRYNTIKGNVKCATPLDLAKPFQYDYNYLRAKMKKEEATEIGNILSMTMKAKPSHWSWQQWFDVLKNDKILVLSDGYEGYNPNDTLAFRALNLSKQNEILGYIQRLSDAENQIYAAMNRSPAAMGQIGQYATDTNIQQSMAGAESLTMAFFNRHQVIMQEALNGLLNVAMVAYKEYGYQKDIVLDEFSKMYFEKQEPFKASSFQLYVVNDMEERKKVETMRARSLEMLQNGGDFADIARMQNAGTIDEMVSILEDSRRRQEEAQQAQREFEMQQQKQQQDMLMQQAKMKMEFDKAKYEFEGNIKLQTSQIMASQMLQANDVDQNAINDANERQDKELIMKAEIEQAKLDLEREKLEVLKFKQNNSNNKGGY